MILFAFPWIELSLLFPLLGAFWVRFIRSPERACWHCLGFTGLTFVCTFLAWLGFYLTRGESPALMDAQRVRCPVLLLDELSAPLLPTVALLHFLIVLATARVKMPRISYTWFLVSESIRLATFSTLEPWLLIGLLALVTVPPYLELRWRRLSTRIFLIHMSLFIGLLVLGWSFFDPAKTIQPPWVTVPLLLAVLIRSGAVPAHCWLTDLFEKASFATALLFATPITGVYAAVRLVLPYAENWVLEGLSLLSLITALYASGMALIQQDARRFFCFLFLSHASLILVGLEQATALSLTGALCLWFSVMVSLAGLGITIRALEARSGRVTLTEYRGLYEHTPTMAMFFLLTGLASVGFPGTLGFVSTELLVDGVVTANLSVGFVIGLVAALNGIAVLRAYFLLFTGTRHPTTVRLHLTLRERLAVGILAAMILGGGLFPQPGVASRYKAAERVLGARSGTHPDRDDRLSSSGE